MTVITNLGSTAPAQNGRAVSPDATEDLPDGPCRALWVGGAGNLQVVFAADTAPVVLTGVTVGLFPFAVRSVRSGSTTATNIVALY